MKLERVDAEIKKELSSLIAYDIEDSRLTGALVSVMKTETSGDLKHCKVFISVMNGDGKEVIEALKKHSYFLRGELFRRLRIRAVPELQFILDDSVERGFKIDKIIKDINK
jgi:ribosome-binding factor A